MMLRYSFDLEEEAVVIENAVKSILNEGYRTPDLMEPGMKLVNTVEMGDLVTQKIKN
jgi:3-isopropylmalate dehydrogenase